MGNNITKILFRRGLDSQRKTVVFSQGEPAYCLDTNRLFVGDGTTLGGNPVGIVNYGIIPALSGSYVYNSTQTNLASSTFILLSAANIGDIVYDAVTTSLYSVSSTSAVLSLSNLAHYFISTKINPSQFYYDNLSQLNVLNGGIGINQLNANITTNSPTIIGGNGSVLNIKTASVGNAYIKPGTPNSVKITNSDGKTISDIQIATDKQILGYTTGAGSLGPVQLQTTGSTTLVSTANTITINSPVIANYLPLSGGALIGGVSALDANNGRLVTDVIPVNGNDVVNLNYVTQFNTCTTPAFIQSNFVNVSGDTMTGLLYGTAFRAAQGKPNASDASTTGYAFNADGDTGLFSPIVGGGNAANGIVALYGNSNELLRGYYSLGAPRIGIGTTTPSANLEIASLGPVIGLIDTGNTSSKFQIGNSSGNFYIYDVVNNAYPITVNPSTLNNQLLHIYNGNVGIGVQVPVFTFDVRGDVNIGNPTQGTVNTSGNKLWFGGSDNTDALYTYRYNVSSNQTEWRFNIGDDTGTAGTVKTDYFVIGNFPSGSTTWTSWMRVGSNTTTFSGAGVFTGTVTASSFYANTTPIAANQLTRKDYVDNACLSASTPAGQVSFFATLTAPTGWLKANGAVLPITKYQSLFNVLPKKDFGGGNINTIWWQGTDGPLNFRIPDLRGQFIRGWNDGISNGNSINSTIDSRRDFGSYQADTFKYHNHTITDAGHIHGIVDGGHSHSITDPGHTHGVTDDGHSHTITDNGHTHSSTAGGDIGRGMAVNDKDGHPPAYSASATTGSSKTGIAIDSHATGITINSNTTGISNVSSKANISITTHTTGITIDNTGDTETRPSNIALLACIKY